MWKFLGKITRNLNIRKVFEGGDIKVQVLTQRINFGCVPFLAYCIGFIFFKTNPYMTLGLLLAGLVPTSGMTISWTGFAKGNRRIPGLNGVSGSDISIFMEQNDTR